MWTRSGKLFDHLFGNGLALGLFTRRTNRPHSLFETFYSQRVATKKFVLDVKTTFSPLRHARLDDHNIAKGRRNMKVATRLHQRYAGNLKLSHHLRDGISERAMKERVRAGIEIFKVAREKNNAKGVAISPFDSDLLTVGEHVCCLDEPLHSVEEFIPVRTNKAPDLLSRYLIEIDCQKDRNQTHDQCLYL